MKYFQSLEAVQSAEVEEIMKVPSMNRQSAEEVYGFFHKAVGMNEAADSDDDVTNSDVDVADTDIIE